MRILYTIGHSNHDRDTLISLLKKHNIQCLVDVRRFPKSKKFPHFNREELEDWLLANEIHYLFLGEELGGYRSHGYEAHMKSPLFQQGLDKLKAQAARQVVCIMCAEGDPRGCHRTFICDALSSERYQINHILGTGAVIPHQNSLI